MKKPTRIVMHSNLGQVYASELFPTKKAAIEHGNYMVKEGLIKSFNIL